MPKRTHFKAQHTPDGLLSRHWFGSLLLAILLGYSGLDRLYFHHYKLAAAKFVLAAALLGWWLAQPHMDVAKMLLLCVVSLWWIADVALIGGRTIKGVWWADDALWT